MLSSSTARRVQGFSRQRCTAEIIEPLLPLLDERLGYEGDPAILSYMLLELFVATDKSFMAP